MKNCTQAQWTWGLDVSTKQVALAALHDDGRFETKTLCVAAPPGTRRLWLAYNALTPWVRGIARHRPPRVVFVERPRGAITHASLLDMIGVVKASIYAGLEGLTPFEVLVTDIPIGTWKKNSVGFGNASKEQIRDWAEDFGIDPTASEDECDALGVAVAGQVSVTERTSVARAA